ncbi:MAG: Fe-S protein assembly co-chaperone HscB [Azoarcus sp.]|jgi:molecular chaperone HscB|nr:Fe-S protein assembly co-chaperone HscB [Azoarcus sp.]
MAVDFTADYFALFGLPRRFGIDEAVLDRAWHTLQAEVHPDRHASRPDSERRRAMQGALRVNEAYGTLKKALPRAQYLLELAGFGHGHGHGLELGHGAVASSTMAPEFLIEQMQWREAVAEARAVGDVAALERLAQRLRAHAGEMTTRLAAQIDERRDLEAAADTVHRLMFLDKLRREIDDALAALDG